MSPQTLDLGTTATGRPFTMPLDAAVQTFAILAIRGAGKTCTATVIAEEFCRARLPWICFDPVGVWWGIRATHEGKPGGFPVVVIGGDHADIPLERTAGAKVAEALMAEPVAAVIDLSTESKRFWHTFLTDFCLALMTMSPEIPRHLFIEEAPEFVPQRTRVELTARCKEAIDRIVRLGRNRGYGCTLISQRPATVDKDVLSQCENLLVLRTVGTHDRKALQEWIEAKASDRQLDTFWKELASLPNGTAWWWSPHWLGRFEKVRIRERMTYHPGATRQVGKAAKSVALADVGQFVEKLRRQLTKTSVPAGATGLVRPPRSSVVGTGTVETGTGRVLSVEVDVDKLQVMARQLADWRGRAQAAEQKLEAVRKLLRPDYEALRALFDELKAGEIVQADGHLYGPWLEKAGGKGCKRLLEVMIERRELTKHQLATLATVSFKSSTFRGYMAWLKRNGLVEVDGETVRLRNL